MWCDCDSPAYNHEREWFLSPIVLSPTAADVATIDHDLERDISYSKFLCAEFKARRAHIRNALIRSLMSRGRLPKSLCNLVLDYLYDK